VVHNTKHVQRDHYAQYFWQQGQEQNEVLPPDANHSYTTGRLLGGESAVGDARYNRGTAEFYDIIAALTEDTIWNSTNMLEIFRELETYWPADNTSFFSRGHEGLLNVVEQGIVTDMASKLVPRSARSPSCLPSTTTTTSTRPASWAPLRAGRT